jgi:hypothetical protein
MTNKEAIHYLMKMVGLADDLGCCGPKSREAVEKIVATLQPWKKLSEEKPLGVEKEYLVREEVGGLDKFSTDLWSNKYAALSDDWCFSIYGITHWRAIEGPEE